jgi:hypothetical protein
MTDGFPEAAPARPVWLLTFADLALLLVGFLVLTIALGREDPRRLAAALRAGFGGEPALQVEQVALPGFAPGSAVPPRLPADLAAWALDRIRDPRVRIVVTGVAPDPDPATGSPAILAAARAQALAGALIDAGLPADRIDLAARRGPTRAAYASVAFSDQ